MSLKNLQTAARIARNDFTFVFGSDRFQCDRFQAAFLSPLIANALSVDPTVNEFVFQIQNSNSEIHIDSASTFAFNSIIALHRLIRGEAIQLSKSQINEMASLCEFLGNPDLNEQIVTFCTKGEELSVSNSLLRYR
jgi:hypothetical protein